ncbi:putative structural protein [Pseudomonas phage BroderSalsa]|nr:putative structural protein [Pseudomonas phage BroderSalsa]
MLDLQRQEIRNPVGILLDPSPSDLPPNAWSGGRNVRFKNGRASKAQGHEEVFAKLPDDREPLHLMPYLSDNTPFWFVATKERIFRTEGHTWMDVTRGGDTPVDYNASTQFNWNGGFLSGVAVLNNGRDVPQVVRATERYFQDIPAWPDRMTAKIVRPYKNYLVALNITKDSVQMPTVVKWSSPADPGELPFTWDETDPKNDAGETPLADTAGAIVDGRKLKDQFIIYKEDSVYSMRYIGGVYVFAFQQLFDDVGMLAPNCAAEFNAKHFVVGQGDVYIHNGVTKQSVIDGKMKNYLYNAINAGGGNNSVFVVPDYNNTEMWVCFQSTVEAIAGGYADRAAIWNWQEDTWTIRELPKLIHGTYGVLDPQQPDHWDVKDVEWDSVTTVWGNASYNPAKAKLVLASKENKAVYMVGDTTLFDKETFVCRLEKTDMYDGNDQTIKHIHTLTPHIRGDGNVKIWIGSNMIQDSPTEWKGPYTYRIGRDYKVDCRVSGRYIGVRFEFDSVGSWEFNGYTIEQTATAGKR